MLAPVALVAAPSETSILSAIAILAFVLKQPSSRRRIAPVYVIAAGAAAMALA